MKSRLAISAAALFLVFAALWTYVRSNDFSQRIRPYVLGPLQEALGPGAEIGRIKANLLPLSIEARDVVIPVPASRNVIAIRRIRAYINPFPLLYRSLSLPSLMIQEPRIAAERSADGTFDLEALVRSIRENLSRRGSATGPSFDIHLRTITVRNGTLTVTEPSSGRRVLLAKLNGKARLSFPDISAFLRITSGELTVTTPTYPALGASVQGAGSFEHGTLTLQSAELRSEGSRASLSGTARIAAGGALDFRITARTGRGAIGRIVVNILRRGMKAREPVMEASATVKGTLADPLMDGRLRVADLPLRDYVLQSAELRFSLRERVIELAGESWKLRKGERELHVDRVRLSAAYRKGGLESVNALVRTEDAELAAVGEVHPDSGLDLSLSGESRGSGATLSFLAGSAISGEVKVKGTLSGPVADPLFEGALNAGPLVVRGVPFQSVDGLLSLRERMLSLVGATVRQAESRYLLDGSVDLRGDEPRFHVQLGVIRSDVVSIIALFTNRLPLGLAATGEITFDGTPTAFTGAGRLDLGPGTAYGESFDRGVVTAELNSSRVIFPRVVLEKKQGIVSGKGWIGFDGTYFGSVTVRGVDLAQVDRLRGLDLSGPFLMDITSSGSFAQPAVHASVESGALAFRKTPLGGAQCQLDIENGKLQLIAATEGDEGSAFSVIAGMRLKTPYPWTLTGNLNIENADPSLLTGGGGILARLRASAEGSLNARGNGFDPLTVSGRAVFPRIALAMGDYRVANDGAAVVSIEQGAFRAERVLLAGEGTRLSLTGTTGPGEGLDLDFSGDVNLSLLRLLYREVEHGDGIASLRLAVRESWSRPDFEGELVVRDGVVKVRDLPQRFTALNGRVQFGRDRIVTEGLSAEVGGGIITVEGSAQLRGTALVDFSARTIVDNVGVRYPAGLTASLGGTLYYDGDTESQTLSGELRLLRARYEKRIEWKSMLVDFSKGVTQRRKTDIGWIGETRLNVRFIGSENVLFESNLAKIPLSIDLMFQGTVNQPQLLGRIEARKGEVYFRNNVFRILYASADLVDPLRVNPVLDVQAETRVRDYRIRLAVTGNADRAVVTFLSDPALSDSDILAMLALGRRGEELKGKEANVGVGEATSFATGKFQDFLESRARSLTGLDRFQVDPYINKQDTAVPRVTVGKELMQDKLHMTYSSNVGGTTPEQNIRVEYFLNRNISLIGEYDELGQIGADLKFRFEFR